MKLTLGIKKLFVAKHGIESERLYLVPLSRIFSGDFFAYSKDKKVNRYTQWDNPKDIYESNYGLKRLIKRNKSNRAYVLAIVCKESLKMIGTIGFDPINFEDFKAEIGYSISSEYWGRGIGKEAFTSYMNHALPRYNFRRIEARCVEENTASIKLLEGQGFVKEGLQKDGVNLRGRFYNVVLLAKLLGEI